MREGCRALGVKNAGLETGLFQLPSEHGEVFVTCLEVSCHQMEVFTMLFVVVL